MRKLLTASMATIFCLALVAAPASAKPKPPKPPKAPYTYTATIDCGGGPVVVGSYDDLWADLDELDRHRKYKPVEWNVSVGGQTLHFVKPGRLPRRTVVCSYSDDSGATGTVTVKDTGVSSGRDD